MTSDYVELNSSALRSFLEAQGTSRAELAQSLNITTKTIQRWMNGSVKKVKPDTLKSLAEALGVQAELLCKTAVVFEQCPVDRALEEICSEKFLQRVRAVNDWDSYRKILRTYVDRDLPTGQRMTLNKHLGFSSLFLGRLKSAKLHLDKSLELAEALQNPAEQIFILNWLAIHAELVGDILEALPLLGRAEKLLSQANNPACDADFYFKRGRVLHHLERHEEAVRDLRRSISIDHSRENKNQVMIAVKYFHMAGSYLRARDFQRARVAFHRNLVISEKAGWVRGQAYSLFCMSVMGLLQGHANVEVRNHAGRARKLRNASYHHRLDSKVEQIEFFYLLMEKRAADAKQVVVKRLSSTRLSRLHFAYAVLDGMFLAKLHPEYFQIRPSFVEKAESLFKKNQLSKSLRVLNHLRNSPSITLQDVLALYTF